MSLYSRDFIVLKKVINIGRCESMSEREDYIVFVCCLENNYRVLEKGWEGGGK